MRVDLMLWGICSGLMLALLLPGCAACPKAGDCGSSADAIFGGWTLVSVGGDPIDKTLGEGMQPPDMRVSDDGSISGFAGVNRFSGRLDLGLAATGGFSSGPFAVTRMAGPPEAMELESRVLTALQEADRFLATADRLTLTKGDAVLLVYTAAR